MYVDSEKLRNFEDKHTYLVISERNIAIGKYLEFIPEQEWVVGSESGICYSPKNCYCDTLYQQKLEAERFYKEQLERFPNGYIIKQGHKPIMLQYYPNFHLDWNHLMEAVNRLYNKGKCIHISPNSIFETWETVFEKCKEI